MNGAFNMNKRAFPTFPMDQLEQALNMNPNVNVGPTVSVGMPQMQTSGSPFFSEHQAFQDYINRVRLQAATEAAAQAKGSAETGSRRNLLGLATLGGLGGGLIGVHRGGNLTAAIPSIGAGALMGGVAGLAAPSQLGNVALGAGVGALPGAYLGHQLGKKYPKYAIPSLIAGLLGGAGIGGAMGS
jgi:hypothetical protein